MKENRNRTCPHAHAIPLSTVRDQNSLRIGELAKATGTSTKTIRFYEERGLLPPARRAANGYRMYGQEAVERLRFIRGARSLDFALDDLQEVLALRERGEAPCRSVVKLMARKRVEVGERIRQLRLLQADLEYLLEAAGRLPDDAIDDAIDMKKCICHLIAAEV